MRWILRGPNGLSAYYEAHDLRAFDGQALRAEMRRARVPAWRAWLICAAVRLVGTAAFRGDGRD